MTSDYHILDLWTCCHDFITTSRFLTQNPKTCQDISRHLDINPWFTKLLGVRWVIVQQRDQIQSSRATRSRPQRLDKWHNLNQTKHTLKATNMGFFSGHFDMIGLNQKYDQLLVLKIEKEKNKIQQNQKCFMKFFTKLSHSHPAHVNNGAAGGATAPGRETAPPSTVPAPSSTRAAGAGICWPRSKLPNWYSKTAPQQDDSATTPKLKNLKKKNGRKRWGCEFSSLFLSNNLTCYDLLAKKNWPVQ